MKYESALGWDISWLYSSYPRERTHTHTMLNNAMLLLIRKLIKETQHLVWYI